MCPGVLRPWQADDGLLVRLRLIGGRVPVAALRRLLAISAQFADGDVHLTARANLQVRGFSGARGVGSGALPPDVVDALESTGLLPSRTHELVRNVLVSPQTGLAGGRADLRGTARDLDAAVRADAELGTLPGRFLFTLDDGRGDLMDRLTGFGRRGTDLGLVALDDRLAQLRVGRHWGEVVDLRDAHRHLAGLASAFLSARGSGPDAPWHVRELATPLRAPVTPDARLPRAAPSLPYGPVPGGTHVRVPDGILTPTRYDDVAESLSDEVVVTPWHGLLIP